MPTYAEEKVVWQEKLIDDGQYYKSYSYQGCTIFVPRGREGLIIEARDESPERTLIQVIKTYEGDQRREIKYRKIYKILGSAKQMPCKNGYDIFAIKYREAAKKLPPNVRDMFFGNYGL